MIPIVYRDIDSALVFTKPLDTKLPLGRCKIVTTEINISPDVVIVIVEKLARLVQLRTVVSTTAQQRCEENYRKVC